MIMAKDANKITRLTRLFIMQASKNFKSNKLQGIFRRSKSISKNFVKHMNNWDERILDNCEELSVRLPCKKELQGSKLKGLSGKWRVFRGIL